MGYTLIIAEKPDAARRIAEAIADKKPKIIRKNEAEYYEFTVNGKKHVCAPAVGHLFVLSPIKTNKGWSYPIFSYEWVPTYTKKGTEWTKKYFENIKGLVKGADEFIDAADVDTEGEVLLYNILRFICGAKDAKRMQFSTLTKDELIESYRKMSNHILFPMLESGLTRHELDWLWGINLTRALTLALKTQAEKGFAILSAGRVQSPTLNLLLERELEIRKFKPKPFWQLELHVKADGQEIIAMHQKEKFWNKEEVDKVLIDCKGKDAVVKDIKKREYKQRPPFPFNTTDLQAEAYACFKFSPTQTLQIAESLYQQGFISYPRSSSQKLPQSINYEKILKALATLKPYEKFARELLAKEKLIPNEGPKEDPAHPCFPSEAKFSLNPDGEMSFEDLCNYVISWKWDDTKKSYFGEISKPIKILSFDSTNNKIVSSFIIGCWKTPYNKSLIRFVSKSNNSIELTPNHPVMCLDLKEGFCFKEANRLKVGDIILLKQKKERFKDKIILREEDFIKTFTEKQKEKIRKYKKFKKLYKKCEKKKLLDKLGISDSTFYRWKSGKKPTIIKTIKRAKKQGLLPLKYSNPKTLIIARLLGHIFGDGYIGCKHHPTKEDSPVAFFEAQEEEITQIKKDIEALNSKWNNYRKLRGISVIWSNDSVLTRTLIALGAPVGNKTLQLTPLPKWIANAPKDIKKEFLAAYFGSEMSKPLVHTKNPRDLKTLTVLMYKDKGVKGGGLFLLQIKKCLKEFGINSDVKIVNRRRKVKIIYQLSIKNSRENLINFFKNIGYRYCNYKDLLARKCLAYLLLRKMIVRDRKEKMKIAKKLYRNGLNLSQIAKEIGIPKNTIKGWLYYKKGRKEEHVPINELSRFVDFNIVIPQNLVAEEIKEIKVGRKVDFVFDLEVDKYHTFFVNDHLVHNCVYATHEAPDLKKLTAQQKKIYDLIVRRTLATFAEEALRESVNAILAIGENKFIAVGKRTIKPGWTAIYSPYLTFEEQILPELKIGQTVKVIKLNLLSKETQPPARYSQGSIIKELEKRNLGTKATRAEILQTLYDRRYIFGKSIQVTKLGEVVAKTLRDFVPNIVSEELTRHFEREMEKVFNNKKKREEVVEEAKKVLSEILEDFKSKEDKIGKKLLEGLVISRKEERRIGVCPNCGGELRIIFSRRTGKRFVGCSNYPKCKTGYPLPLVGQITSLNKNCEVCNLPMIQVWRKGKRPFRMCINPNCKTKESWNKNKTKS